METINDISSADENKQQKYHGRGSVSKLQKDNTFIHRLNIQKLYLFFERNNAGLKKLPQVLSEQTSDSAAFLNAMCL
jgi:hypothetical protein